MSAANDQMHALARRLFPICRSITGEGVRQTLRILRQCLPDLQIHEVPSGTRCLDWEVPEEWNIEDAVLTGPDGEVVADFKRHNLHVVGYSEPVDRVLTLEALQPHLHSLPEQPDAIPYVTSYYQRTWGFCLEHRKREALKPGNYHARIRSSFSRGSLTYGELVIPGSCKDEVFLSTYICHPSMANNELSGPVVTTFLAQALQTRKDPRLTCRVVFIPETIGSLVYLSRHLEHLRRHMRAGFVVTCAGDERAWSYLASRCGDTLADRAARHVLGHLHPGYETFSYLQRGSDERQYCWPGVDLPVCSVMRTKYGRYPEYHTSLDNLELITERGMRESLEVLKRCVLSVEVCRRYRVTVLGEPQMGRRGLYPTLSRRGSASAARLMMNVMAYCDGGRDLIELAELLRRPVWELQSVVETLLEHGLLEPVDEDGKLEAAA